MRILSILIFALFLNITVFAQYGQQNKSSNSYFTAKLNLPSFAFNNLSVIGEYSFNGNKSALLGFEFHYPKGTLGGRLPETQLRRHLTGYFITPEFRFYTGENAPFGFYFGPYLRFMNLGTDWSGKYAFDSITIADYTISLKLHEYAIGFQVGYQYVSPGGFSFDYFIAGPRLSYFNFKGKIDGILDDQAIFDIIGLEGLDENGYYGIGKSIIDKFTDYATISVPTVFFAIRTGFAIGYTF